MGAERLPMRRIREVLRLKYEGGLKPPGDRRGLWASAWGRCRSTSTGPRSAGLCWPLPADLDDAALEARLFPAPAVGRERVMPDLAELHQELKGVGVTLQLLWEEYRGVHGEGGYGYSQFCELYRRWAGKLRPSMRQVHRAGEKLFVDFSGKRPHIVDRRTGELVAGRAVRRGAGGEQLHLRRGDGDPEAARVGRRARSGCSSTSAARRRSGSRTS